MRLILSFADQEHQGGRMIERNLGQWSFVLAIYGLILILLFVATRLIHYDNTLFLVVYGLLCVLGLGFGAFLGWKERTLRHTKSEA